MHRQSHINLHDSYGVVLLSYPVCFRVLYARCHRLQFSLVVGITCIPYYAYTFHYACTLIIPVSFTTSVSFITLVFFIT